jgi:acylphosphatase
MIRRRVVVHGRVQGVFFRDSCRRQAVHHRVSGWVRNRPDGTVEAVFEGDPDEVEAMTRWCHQGPASARVERVDSDDEPTVGEQGFELRG